MKEKIKFIPILLIIVLACFFYYSVENVKSTQEEESYEILSDAIRQSVVQCYAIEGYYPPNIQYLEDNYGLIVDHEKYVVSYTIFASNIMPNIEVYLK